MRWVCLLLPYLAMDAVLRTHADPTCPLVLITGPAPRRALHSVSPAAAALGLRRGMLVSAAQALTGAFIPHEFDPKLEAQARDLLARRPTLDGIINLAAGNRGIERAVIDAGRARDLVFVAFNLNNKLCRSFINSFQHCITVFD